jgi:hypothetical protein
MKGRILLLVAGMISIVPRGSDAAGLLYRSVSTGQWVGIAAANDTRATGVFATRQFKTFPGAAKAPLAYLPGGAGCGVDPISVAAFSAQLTGSAPNTGIFLYDATTDTIIDAVIEGATTPAGGTFKALNGTNPGVAIEVPACKLHVFFRATIVGAPLASDTGIFDATFDLTSSFASLGISVIAHEGTTLAPNPAFPATSTFGDFSSMVKVSARDYPNGGSRVPSLAFRGKIIGGGVTGTNDTAVFVWSPLVGFFPVAKEGDPSCAPNWAMAGSMYDDFPASMEIAASGAYTPGNPSAVYRAKGRGAPTSGTDTAIELGLTEGCGAAFTVVWGIEGQPTPAGGTHGDFPPSTPLDGVSGDPHPEHEVAFLGTIVGGAAPKALFLIGNSYFANFRHGFPDTALAGAALSLPANIGPALGAGGRLAFRGSISGLTSGLLTFHNTNANPAQLLSFAGSRAQVDKAGNMTARFP